MVIKVEHKLKKVGEISFWIAFIIELLIVIVDKSAYTNPYESMLFRLTFVLFGIKIVTTKYSRKEWLCIILFGAIAALSYLINSRDEIVRIIAFVAACKGINLKNMIRVCFSINSIGIIVLFVLSGLNVFGDFYITANFGRGVYPGIIETRYCFGMGHPNAFQCMLFVTSCLGLYLYAKEMKIYYFAFLVIINFVSYQYTDSNTSFLVMMAVILGVMLLKYVQVLQNSKSVYILASILFVFVVLFSAYGSHVGIGNQIMDKIDTVLNGRFKTAFAIEAARIENWKLFGDVANEEYFDQGFIRLFYWYGIIPGVVYTLLNVYLIYQGYKNKDYVMMVLVVGFGILTIMEAHFISFYILRNYVFIFLGYYWYQPFRESGSAEMNLWEINKLLGKA